MAALILHITSRDAWEAAMECGEYRPARFAVEGFIHCSTREQVVDVANVRFRGQRGLVLLGVDPERVDAPIRYENLEGGERLFPHIYGPLECAAVTGVWPFEPQADGTFALPAAVAD